MSKGNPVALARAAARKYGIPESIFLNMGRAEGGLDKNGNPRRSSAGAIGWGQLMPGTAKGLGVNPYDLASNIDGAARYLKQQYKTFGSWRLALAAYNAGPGAVQKYGGVPPFAETERYVARILANAADSYTTAGKPRVQAGGVTGLDVPDFRQSVALNNLRQLAAGSTLRPSDTLTALVQAKAASGGTNPAVTSTSLPASMSGGTGTVTVAKGADRAGVSLQPAVLAFARKVAGLYGNPITIGTGTNHNQYVAGTTRQSAHWTGWAADVPATGAALIRLGQAALIAAGADPKWARKQKGGLFNVGGFQIIYSTDQGGNHWGHLHIGLRGHK